MRIRPLEPVGAQVRDTLDGFRPDLVHVTSPGALGRKALKHTRRNGVPRVVVEQAPALDVAADYWRAKVADRADAVLVTSSWMVDRMAEFGVSAGLGARGRHRRVHPGAARPVAPRRLVPGPVGRTVPRSSSGTSAGCTSATAYAGWPRWPRSPAPAGRHRRRSAARLAGGQGARRQAVGPLQTGDLTIALPSLDVLVHPGEHETCCHALREAAASGVPVVAPRSGGAPDVVRHLESGLLYDPRDPRDLRRAVTAVVADRHRSLLGKRARELAQLRTWTDAVDELMTPHYPVSVRPVDPAT